MTGFSLSMLSVKQFNLNDGSENYFYNVGLQFESIQEFENDAVVQFGSDVKVMNIVDGLLDINLSQVSPIAAGRLEVKALAGCGAEDLYDTYSAELNAVGVWVATNTATGNAITITSVTVNATGKSFGVLLDVTDTDYPAVGETVTLKLAAVSVLEAAGISGFEGCAQTFTIV